MRRIGTAVIISTASVAGWAQEPTAPSLQPVAPVEETALPEPDYAVVADDARNIAEEIESRLIEAHMSDARGFLNETDAVHGHPKAEEAYVDMEQMIKFCEATAGKAGSACKFKLQIKMSLNPGNTLGQLGKSLGQGIGGVGLSGQGSGGQSSASRFGLYGPKPFGQPSKGSSRPGDQKVNSQSAPNGGPDPLAGNVEELAASKRDDLNFSVDSEARILEEYRSLIEGYFRRLAEEEKK